MKSILMKLIGLSPVWEVRVVNATLNKRLPGTCLHRGTNYGKAVVEFEKHCRKHRPGHEYKLQAVIVTRMNIGMPKVIPMAKPSAPVSAIGESPFAANVKWDEPELAAYKETVLATKAETHQCDIAGPLVLVDGFYVATCSICEAPQ
jgi:hypothetical protein